MLDAERVSVKFHSVSAAEGSVGVLEVGELDKSVAALRHYVDHLSIGGEKVPQVRIRHVLGQSAHVELEDGRGSTSAPLTTLVLRSIRSASFFWLLMVAILFVAAHRLMRVATASPLIPLILSLRRVVVIGGRVTRLVRVPALLLWLVLGVLVVCCGRLVLGGVVLVGTLLGCAIL